MEHSELTDSNSTKWMRISYIHIQTLNFAAFAGFKKLASPIPRRISDKKL